MSRLHHMLHPALLALLISSSLGGSAAAGPFQLSYAGRLANAAGDAVTGPVDIELRFYTQASGGAPLGVSPLVKTGIKLDDGMFQVDLTELTPAETHLVFSSTTTTWVEVIDKSHNVTYPRQKLTAVPYAFKVPVDGSSIGYDANGQLTIKNVDVAAVPSMGAALAAKADQTAVTTALAAKADQAATAAALAVKAEQSALTALAATVSGKAADNAALSGDVGGTLTATTVNKIRGVTVTAPVSGTDDDKFLKYNGTTFVLEDVTSANGGTVTEVTASLPLSVTSGTITPALTIAQATAGASGYLSNADWGTFNSKQAAITAGSTVNTGTLTTALQNGVEVKPHGSATGNTGELRFGELTTNGSHYVGFKAPDDVPVSKIWTLPDADGAAGQVLKTDGNGALSWATPPSAPVTAVAGRTGAVTLDTDDVAEGSTNLYFTAARAQTVAVADVINDGTTAIAPSQNAVFDALAAKADSASVTTSLSGKVSKTGDTMSGALNMGGYNLTNVGDLSLGTDKALMLGAYSSDPTGLGSFDAGKVWFNSTAGVLKYWDGATASTIGIEGAGVVTALAPLSISGTNISLGPVLLTSHVSGTLPVANGGTGATSLASNSVLLGSGTAAVQTVAPGTFGNVLTSNGSTWQSTAPAPVSLANPGPIGSSTPSTGAFTLVTTSSNVGIGTTAPAAQLHVVGTTNGSAFVDGSLTASILARAGSSHTFMRASSTAGRIGTETSLPLALHTNNTERVTITSSGSVGIGSTAPTAMLDVAGAVHSNGLQVIGPIDAIGGLFSGGNVGIGTTTPAHALDVTGDIRTTGCFKHGSSAGTVVSGGGTCASDARFKKDVTPIAGALSRLSLLRPVHYRYKADEFPNRGFGTARETGFIAQELRAVYPELVVEGDDGYLMVRYGLDLQMETIAAVKELNADAKRLHTDLAALRADKDAQIAALQADAARKDEEIAQLKELVCLDHPAAALCKR